MSDALPPILDAPPKGARKVADAAAAWGVSPGRVRQWIDSGRVQVAHVRRGKARVDVYVTTQERPSVLDAPGSRTTAEGTVTEVGPEGVTVQWPWGQESYAPGTVAALDTAGVGWTVTRVSLWSARPPPAEGLEKIRGGVV